MSRTALLALLAPLVVLPTGCGGSTRATGAADGSAAFVPTADAATDATSDDESIPVRPLTCGDCADESQHCLELDGGGVACVQCAQDGDCTNQGFTNSNAVCLPDHTCGCNADSQCAGQREGARCVNSQCGCQSPSDCSVPGALTCAANDQCGCGKNADCMTGYVCDLANGRCVGCVTDADCTDPNDRACDATLFICAPCHTSADCAKNAEGPTCVDVGANSPNIGSCSCAQDSECAGRAAGPHCVSNGGPLLECGCQTASDCAQSPQGHACINPYNDGWLQCGCSSGSDCSDGGTCGSYVCPG